MNVKIQNPKIQKEDILSGLNMVKNFLRFEVRVGCFEVRILRFGFALKLEV